MKTPWNPEHLGILKKSVDVWNSWREENPTVHPNLASADLSGAYLYEANLNNTILGESNFSGANLSWANLSGAYFGWGNLSEANLNGADLRGSRLVRANLNQANLNQANLGGANLSGAYLLWSSLNEANLNGADLRGARLARADLSRADLSEADLSHANLTKANLSHANLDRSILAGTRFEEATTLQTSFHSPSLGSAMELDMIQHAGPSNIGPQTLENCGQELPDAFLKGIGFKDWEVLAIRLRDPNLRQDEVIDITYQIADMRTQSPIQTNSVFLSYSREDSDFVDAIGERLDKDRVRYWRDRHDISVGPIEGQIERAINLNGTVLLVLSKNSIHSEWVEFEVRKARDKQRELQKERGKQVHVLCPVALDDSWESCPWPERLRQDIMEYHVLDCSDWEKPSFDEKYKKLRTNLGIYYFDQDRE